MNGSQIKQAAIQKAKSVAAGASNGNASKKRKKDLKPIITTEGNQESEGVVSAGYVYLPSMYALSMRMASVCHCILSIYQLRHTMRKVLTFCSLHFFPNPLTLRHAVLVQAIDPLPPHPPKETPLKQLQTKKIRKIIAREVITQSRSENCSRMANTQ
jgi:hypothetical protein